MQFSTLNESDLHHSLKILYATTYEGDTEVSQDGHIYDIVTKNGNVIEIQTGNLSKLLPKIKDTIKNCHNIKIIYPLIITRRIYLSNEKGEKISYRRSPKKGNILNIFDELTGIYSILLDKHFSLEVVEVEITEERIRTTEPVQTQNKRRRFKKNWYKVNKKLDSILATHILNKKEDYIKLLVNSRQSMSVINVSTNTPMSVINSSNSKKGTPMSVINDSFPTTFCAKDINTLLHTKKGNLILWVLVRMEVVEVIEVKNRSRYYRFTE